MLASRSVGSRQSALALIVLLALPACGGDGPGERELRAELASQFPTYLEAASFSLEEREALGTEEEPAWASRFRAELKLREDTYEEVRREGDVLFVRRVAASGEERTVTGLVNAALMEGSWSSSLAFDEDPTPALGRPLAEFDAPRVIVLGSDAEKQYQAERRTALFTTGSFSGVATGYANAEFPIQIRFTGFDERTMRVQGEVKWPSLGGATKRFEGNLSGRSVAARETAWVNRGDGSAMFGLEYRIEIGPTLDAAVGSWSGQGYGGKIQVTAG